MENGRLAARDDTDAADGVAVEDLAGFDLPAFDPADLDTGARRAAELTWREWPSVGDLLDAGVPVTLLLDLALGTDSRDLYHRERADLGWLTAVA